MIFSYEMTSSSYLLQVAFFCGLQTLRKCWLSHWHYAQSKLLACKSLVVSWPLVCRDWGVRPVSVSTKPMIKVLMRATAMHSYRAQCEHLNHICNWVKIMASIQAVKPKAMLWVTKYDETPLYMRVHFSSSDDADPQKAKIHVIEAKYVVAFSRSLPDGDGEENYIISCALCPQLAASDRKGSGEAISTVLSHSVQPPPDELTSIYPFRCRVVESDALPANAKAEKLLQAEPAWRNWDAIEVHCYCHRAHAAAVRVFDLIAINDHWHHQPFSRLHASWSHGRDSQTSKTDDKVGPDHHQ